MVYCPAVSAHQAGQPALQAGAAGPAYPHQLHSDQDRSGGPGAPRHRALHCTVLQTV